MKNQITLVLGPWGSGTSAYSGVLVELGLHSPPPYHRCSDPRTPNTYESKLFRDMVLDCVSEPHLRLVKSPAEIVDRIYRFREAIDDLAKNDASISNAYVFKHPLASFVLPQLKEVFPTLQTICVLRKIEEIEATRQRRKWHPIYGEHGASTIYGAIFKNLIEQTVPIEFVWYSKLIERPRQTILELADAIGIEPVERNVLSAIDLVTRKR